MITFWGVLVVLGVLVVARYGDGSSSEASAADASGREPARPVLAAFARRFAAQRQLSARFEDSLRPWESRRPWESPDRPGVTR